LRQQGVHPVLMAHDEGVFLVPEDRVDDAYQSALQMFETPPPWAEGLPVTGEAVVASDYSAKP